jgi:hypothetical protein
MEFVSELPKKIFVVVKLDLPTVKVADHGS